MNWRRLLAALQICVVVGGAAIVGATFWGMLFAAAAQKLLGLDEMQSMLFVFVPSASLIAIYLLRSLPAPLRKAGMLSDSPKAFGSWRK
ncbi:hypothetical protein [Cupriavidus sp. TMH.W2]|uniref:hypothetical protein n=1 Tax=Cupriavidus sp. TMH.W2 TaxID=3434465 RepID=UPI003D76BF6D